jgi:hypothetical protein
MSVPAFSEELPVGGNGGTGQPSATSVPSFAAESPLGGKGGTGQPSAVNAGSASASLPAESLTEPITGSTIKTAKTRIAAARIGFFKGLSLLPGHPEEGSRLLAPVLENVLKAEHEAG